MSYQPQTIKSSDLRTEVEFYSQESSGPEPGSNDGELLYHCLVQAYSPSNKDLTILNSHGVSEGLTINMPDAMSEFVPDTKMLVKVIDYRYSDTSWNVIDVAPDFENNRYVKLVLGRDKS